MPELRMSLPRRVLAAATLFVLPLAGCGGGEVTVQVMGDQVEGESAPVSDLPVSFIPYDRDSVFDALAATAPEPEPSMDPELVAATEEVARLQAEWRSTEDEWATVRDSLKNLSDRLQNMDPRSREYRQLYEQFNQLDQRESRLRRENEAAFAAFDSLQRATLRRSDSMRAVMEAWEEVAFENYLDVVAELEEARGAETIEDTTDADGFVRQRLRGSPWYVSTRLPTQWGHLYWNIRIDPAGADTLILTPDLAERRMQP